MKKYFTRGFGRCKFAQSGSFVGRLDESGLISNLEPDTGLPTLNEKEFGQYLEDADDEDAVDEPEVEQPPHVPETDKDFPDFPSTDAAMGWAYQNGEQVKIYYVTKRGGQIERVIEPHGEYMARTTGNRILVTFDRTVGDIRAFIVDNILYYMFVDEKFDHRERLFQPQGLKA